LPAAARNLIRVAEIKLQASALGLEKIDAAEGGGYLLFGKETRVDPLNLVRLVQREGQGYRMQGAHRLQFRLDMNTPDKRFAAIELLLRELATSDNIAKVATG
jgi:transcription-repair coupling factor (superfamily II helicase)